MAEIFNAIEEEGHAWPEALTQAAVPLIPKDGSNDPMQQRPVTILSCAYRAYAGLRYDDLQCWRAQWVDDSIFGGEIDREAIQASLDAAIDVEKAQVLNETYMGALLDYSILLTPFLGKLFGN